MTTDTRAEDRPPPLDQSISATNHSVAIGSVNSLNALSVEAQTVTMNFNGPVSSASGVEAAGPNPLATSNAVLLGPLASTEAQGLVDRANELREADPYQALELLREVQKRLRDAGFSVHAAEFDDRVAALCVATGDEGTAVLMLMRSLWEADTSANSLRAQQVLSASKDLAGFPDFGPYGSEEARTPLLGAAVQVAQFVDDHLQAPVPLPIDFPGEAVALLDGLNRARAVLFAAECALGDDNAAWIASNRHLIESSLNDLGDSDQLTAIRLRLTLADAAGEWDGLIRVANAGIPRELRALVLARYARFRLRQAAPADADENWRAAVGEACLSHRYEDAADWLFSQRAVANRFGVLPADKYYPLADGLLGMASKPRIIPAAKNVREHALAALHFGKARPAAISLRRHLLEAIRSASFVDEQDARGLLGAHYLTCGELPLAAFYTIAAGNYKEARDIADAFGDTYHDVASLIESPLSWVCASALQFIAQQADLIPDDHFDAIVGQTLQVITDVESGVRLDSPVFSPQMRHSAFGLLAAVSKRLAPSDAKTVLDILADSVVAKEHHYRDTDESHIEIAAGIAQTQLGELRETSMDQLIGLFERASYHFGQSEHRALKLNIEYVRERLSQMASDGHHDAAAFLAYLDPEETSPEAAQVAAGRLRTPTTANANGFGVGTGSINDSLVAMILPVEERMGCVDMLLTNATAPWEPATNRDDYLRAAINLVDAFPDDVRRSCFDRAKAFASNESRSEADALHDAMSNPLGAIRIDDKSDARPAAVELAAKLAKSTDEKRLVRDSALRLIGIGSDSDWRVTSALQAVRSEINDDHVGLLAQQRSWTLRSLAAQHWAHSKTLPEALGVALSRDDNVRVRRALATEMSSTDEHAESEVRTILSQDPRWSVRSTLHTVHANSKSRSQTD